jgi:CAAX protease family protein
LTAAGSPVPSRKHAAVPYIAPFIAFLLFLGIQSLVPLPHALLYTLWIAVVGAVLLIFSRGAIDLRVSHPVSTLLVGVLVFVLWIAPDLLFPGYRSFWLFSNPVTGHLHSSLNPGGHHSPLILSLRFARAVIIVPIVEELFWRGWLMRWLIRSDFESVPLGTYAAASFWIVAILFASEHGPYWDVGLMAGVVYNWWMVRTKRLGDLILAHAVTNACLSAYVILAHQWQYWM